jgi:hypothetical protein
MDPALLGTTVPAHGENILRRPVVGWLHSGRRCDNDWIAKGIARLASGGQVSVGQQPLIERLGQWSIRIHPNSGCSALAPSRPPAPSAARPLGHPQLLVD